MKAIAEFWHNPPWFSIRKEKDYTPDWRSADEVRNDLLAVTCQEREDIIRFVVASGVYRLGELGIAPRWSKVIGFAGEPGIFDRFSDIKAIVQMDGPLYDLLWLRQQFPGLKPTVKDWSKVFDKDDPRWWDAALKILKRQTSASAKVRLLGLEAWQSVGCLSLIDSAMKERAILLSSHIAGDEEEEYRRLTRDVGRGRPDGPEARVRARRRAAMAYAARLAMGPSGGDLEGFRRWEDASKVFRWITGEGVRGDNLRRTLRVTGWCGDTQYSRKGDTQYSPVTTRAEGVVSLASSTPVETTTAQAGPTLTPVSVRTCWIGIDPGQTGAAAAIFVDEAGQTAVEVFSLVTKDGGLDGAALAATLRLWAARADVVKVAMEKQHRRPKDSVDGWARLAANVGAVEGVLAGVGLRHECVNPEAWKRHLGLFKGKMEAGITAKRRSVDLARKLFPAVGHLRHDEAEALLIAEWARRTAL